jgi:UDP-glucose:(heptosyl)LPS alpha-1,3-glucosyltransferase
MKKLPKQKKVKKLYFIRANKTKFGGAEVYLSRLSQALTKDNIRHSIVNSIFPKFLPSWLRAILFNAQVCIFKKDKFYFSLERITCPDIYRAGDGVHSVFLTVENKSKLNPLHPVYLFLEKRCLQRAKRIIANSEMIKNQIIDAYNVNPAKIDIVYNGIESKELNYKNSFDRLSKEFLIKEDQPTLLYVGSGFKRKGVKEFLQIVAQLQIPDIKAFVVGKEKNIKYYQQLAIKLRIDNQIIFTGPREDVSDFYTISDIFIFPTHYEPFGNVILEAMNFKNVVFTTRQNGASEILDDFFIMNKPDDFSIINKITHLLDNKSKLKSIKKDNRTLSKQFSIERNLKETLDVVDKLTNHIHLT